MRAELSLIAALSAIAFLAGDAAAAVLCAMDFKCLNPTR